MYACSKGHIAKIISGVAACAMLNACVPLAVTAAGVGGGTAVNHTMQGITYRTFTAPLPRVRSASLTALKQMGIERSGSQKTANGETILAKATGREIEIELESLSPNATRMRVIAKNGGLFYDSATATEIILQTEKVLGNA
jgi:uncharacterized protein DUF3568